MPEMATERRYGFREDQGLVTERMPETGINSCVHASRKNTGAADFEDAVAF